MDLVPITRTLVLSLLSLRKLQENQDLISCRQSEMEDGGRCGGHVEGVICIAMEMYVQFTEDSQKEVNR